MNSIYRHRAVTWHGIAENNGARIKLYGMAAEGKTPDALVAVVRQLAEDVASGPLRADQGTTYGFALAHRARPADFALICSWVTPVDLRAQYLRLQNEEGQPVAMPPGSLGCVWELALIGHERSSWVHRMLRDSSDPEGYLRDVAPPKL